MTDDTIEVKDVTEETRDDKDSPHAQNNLDVHDPEAYSQLPLSSVASAL